MAVLDTKFGWAGYAICVGGPAGDLLAYSKLIADQIADVETTESEFPVYPRILSRLCEPGWLACGSAAMAFDPICGDGTASAVREAILASAAIQAVANHEPSEEVLAYYQARLIAGFKRHLGLCAEYYSSGGRGPWWESELESLRSGIDWCENQSGKGNAFLYRLDGFELHAVR